MIDSRRQSGLNARMPSAAEKIYAVSEFNRMVRGLLETRFGRVRIEGEIASLARPASGHLYFTLKDDRGQIRCAMFRNRGLGMRFRPENGVQVIASGKVSLYEARGDYQLIVDTLEPAGAGALQAAFEALKEKLRREGLFDSERKRPIPTPPRHLAVITSPTGAAIRDVLHVLARRYPLLSLTIHPVPVQGDGAAPAIQAAIAQVNRDAEADLILLTRGGGSIEDLWAFNEEVVARAIADSQIPVISGVGHEIDFTIADFVADQRAPTPSAAAEMITPDQIELRQRLAGIEAWLLDRIGNRLKRHRERLDWLSRRLEQQHPRRWLEQRAQRLDELDQRLRSRLRQGLQTRQHRLADLRHRLLRRSPSVALENRRLRLDQLQNRLDNAWRQRRQTRANRLAALADRLTLLNPHATLQRGYAIIRNPRDGSVISSTQHIRPGDAIRGILSDGEFTAEIEHVD